ncbi:Undecaprenyl-phosphate N-acetylglucosaminyl 1-phosphate transferase [hydrothermal vent metagenome]|uniref:Undecaprenyl-phosphate N-acetylglucosaminyl 1-phosphate transferase n=1 Tax=hydrothermal vent metagenome TaxID=652676 RepID=A0A1W1CBM9_9ZZZZ
MIEIFLYAFFISLFTLMLVIYLSHKYSYFIDCHKEDKPQKFHDEPVPRAGGIGIIIALILLVLTPYGLKLIPSVILAFMSGIFEDFHNSLSPKIRLGLQILASSVAVWLTHSVVTYLGLGITLPYAVGVFFSIFAIVGMMNAINIIDGFNGLASGVVLIILASFAMISFEHHNEELLYVISVSAGAVLGLFVLVFPYGKIFLGDGGAYLLGFLVALIGIFLAGEYEDVSPWYVLAILIYPVWEVIFSIFRKLSIGLSPMQPDNYHIHMLIQRNITNNNPLTALFILILMIPHSIFSTLYAHSSQYNILVVVVFVFCYLMFYWYLRKKEDLKSKKI